MKLERRCPTSNRSNTYARVQVPTTSTLASIEHNMGTARASADKTTINAHVVFARDWFAGAAASQHADPWRLVREAVQRLSVIGLHNNLARLARMTSINKANYRPHRTNTDSMIAPSGCADVFGHAHGSLGTTATTKSPGSQPCSATLPFMVLHGVECFGRPTCTHFHQRHGANMCLRMPRNCEKQIEQLHVWTLTRDISLTVRHLMP